MHDRAIASYPRKRGVVIPTLLVRAGCPVHVGSADMDRRVVAASETVKWVHGSLRRLPAEVLDTTLPDPSVILRSWPLGNRTRGALARLGTSEPGYAWRVRDLIGAKRLGPAALVDLLAAREENVLAANLSFGLSAPDAAPLDATSVSSPVAGRIDAFSRLVESRLPLCPEELCDLLVSSGLSRARLGTGDIIRLFRDWQVPVPFRIVRRGGATVLVAPTSLASAEMLVTTASHLVFHWGLCTLNTVVGRIRSLSSAELGVGAAARVLTSIPRFRWLDEASGWFSFVGYGSRVRLAVRKVFAITDRVSVRELSVALGKRVRALSTAPRAAVEAYLSQVAGCTIDGDWVRRGASFAPAALIGSERTIVDVFHHGGGTLTREALRREAVAAGVKQATLRHFVRTSPLVIARAGELRLVGR